MSKIDHHLNLEEDFFSHDRKSEKKHRKELSAKDRSKYKKTDQDKLEKKTSLLRKKEFDHLDKGRILSINIEGIIVECNNCCYLCSLKGVLKKEKTLQKNLVAVGDIVLFEKTNDSMGVIVYIEPRYSILSRADNLRRNKEQIIAVNIDQLFIVVSVVMPTLKPSLVDRYIIAAKQGNMSPIIVINKIDLLKNPPACLDPATYEQQIELYQTFIEIYKELDIPVIEISTLTSEGIETLKKMMEHKASVFSGQSGVGKTSLINQVLGTSLKTAGIVTRTHKGSHTTTTAQLIAMKNDSFCIDTPGIRSFGIWQITEQDLDHYFSEFIPFKESCRYQNCLHIHEPDCGIKEAVEEGKISLMRYQSYYELKTIPDEQWR